uniref:Uncharacterized protein n=1 Tax=Moniliophthora roreri TaxID=221103 RepID=A0A0W0FNP5_MONRR
MTTTTTIATVVSRKMKKAVLSAQTTLKAIKRKLSDNNESDLELCSLAGYSNTSTDSDVGSDSDSDWYLEADSVYSHTLPTWGLQKCSFCGQGFKLPNNIVCCPDAKEGWELDDRNFYLHKSKCCKCFIGLCAEDTFTK